MIEQNRFNAQEAQKAFERELGADSTKHQREVQDLLAAGINPMMATGMSGGSVHSSPASAVSPVPGVSPQFSMDFNIMDMVRKVKEMKNLDANTANTEADTARKTAETEGLTLDNEIKAATKDAVIEASSLENQLKGIKYAEIKKGLDEADARINKLREEAVTEPEKRSLMRAQGLLANVNARQIVEMLPYTKQLMMAKTEGERQAALLSAAHTAYQNHLIDDGYLDAFIKNMQATADSSEARAWMDKLKTALRSGDYSKLGTEIVKGSFAKDFMQVMTVLLDNLNPLNDIFK